MIDAEGEQTVDRGHVGVDAWARRMAGSDGGTAVDAVGRAEIDHVDDDPPAAADFADPADSAAPAVVAAPERPAFLDAVPDPLTDGEPGEYTERGETAERAAFLGDGAYSNGEFAGGDIQAGLRAGGGEADAPGRE